VRALSSRSTAAHRDGSASRGAVLGSHDDATRATSSRAQGRAAFVLIALAAVTLMLCSAQSALAAPLPVHSFLSETAIPQPRGLATDSAGDLFVASEKNAEAKREVKIFSPSLTEITHFEPAANIASPVGVAVDSAGNVYVQSKGATGDVVKYKPTPAGLPTPATTYAPDTSCNATGTLATGGARGVAVNPANDQVVVSFANHISAYQSDCTAISETIGSAVAGASYTSVAVRGKNGRIFAYDNDLSHRRIIAFNPAGTESLFEVDGADTVVGAFNAAGLAIGIDQASGHIYASDVSGTHNVVDEFDAAGEFVTEITHTPPFGSGEVAKPSSLVIAPAGSPKAGNVYLVSNVGASGKVSAFGPLTYGYKLTVAKAGTGTGTVVSAPAGIDCGSTCETSFGEGTEVTLTATPDDSSKLKAWSGCDSEPGGDCTVALNAAHTVTATFSSKPSVSGEAASQAGTTSATLSAQVNPGGEPTTYHFEYGIGAYDHSTPESLPVGSDFSSHSATRSITGLTPGGHYQFRLVATNALGATTGAGGQFVTYTEAPTFGPCANDVLRAGAGTRLPDCRAYEQVSPVDKNGADVIGKKGRVQASVAVDGITFFALGGIPGGVGAQQFPMFLAHRDGGRWSTQGLLPPASLGPQASVLGWLPDLSQAFSVAGDEIGTVNKLFSRDSADGSFTAITADGFGVPVGASVDGSRALIQGSPSDQLTPDAAPGKQNLFLWDRATNHLSLAGVLPDSSCGSPPCVPVEGSLVSRGGDEKVASLAGDYPLEEHALSSDGDRAWFTDGADGQLYLREGLTGLQPTTVHVSASQRTDCANHDPCGGGPEPDPLGPAPAVLQAATPSGSEALFTSSEELTDDANTGPEPDLPAIGRADLDIGGEVSNVDTGFISTPPDSATDVAVDDSYIYWADPQHDRIGRAEIGGGNPDPSFIVAADNPQGVAVDSAHIYWTNAADGAVGNGKIGRADLPTSPGGSISNVNQNCISGASDPIGIDVGKGADSGHLYWANSEAGEQNISSGHSGAIARADIAGDCASANASANQVYCERIGLSDLFVHGDLAANETGLYWSFWSNLGVVRRVDIACSDSMNVAVTEQDPGGTAPGIALDGSHLYWSDSPHNAIGHADLDGGNPDPEFAPDVGHARGIAVSASHLYWSANQATGLSNPGNDLYRYDVGTDRLTDLTPDAADENGAEVRGVLGTSTDLSRIYFAANGVLADNNGAQGSSATPGDCKGGQNGQVYTFSGACNLYLWDEGQITFIAPLDLGGDGQLTDGANWQKFNKLDKVSRVSDEGILVFRSQAQLTDYDNHAESEFYRYDPEGGLSCLTCNPLGSEPGRAPTLQSIATNFAPGVNHSFKTRNVSADGDRFFFQSAERLVAGDTNGSQGCPMVDYGSGGPDQPSCLDVYEWEDAGSGSCTPASSAYSADNGGCIYLLSTGTSPYPSFFADASASGDDAFIFTRDQLVPQDGDNLVDVYDAGVLGGLGYQQTRPAPGCIGDACRGAGSSPGAAQSSATSQVAGAGNPPLPRRHSCPKGKVRRHGKCVRKHKPRHRRHHSATQRANNDRRAGR
jgi:sugar lactone lactonase YvrE